jgi:RNA polymerase sigma-B factor
LIVSTQPGAPRLEGLEAAAAHHSTSLDAPLEDATGDSVPLADMLGCEEAGLELVEDGFTVTAAVQQLSERDPKVLALRFFHGLTQSEIAKETGVSQQISRTLRQTIARLNELTQSTAVAAGEGTSGLR